MIDLERHKKHLEEIAKMLDGFAMVARAETVRTQIKLLDEFHRRDVSTVILGMLPGKDGAPYEVLAEDVDDINDFVDMATDTMNGLDGSPVVGWLVDLMRARGQDTAHLTESPRITEEDE